MRAAIYQSRGPAREVLKLIDKPDPLPGVGEVRVRVACSGVNPSDVKSRLGTSARPSSFAEIIPHSDGAGVIDAVGPQVPGEWTNRRVWVFNAQWERPYGTAAQYVTLPLRQVVPLPGNTSFETGASLGVPLMTAFHAVAACGSLLGRTVLVFGAAGSVGYYVTQLARLAGARVIGVVSNDTKAAIAKAAGAEVLVNYRTQDVVATVREATGGQGVDNIIEVDAAGNVQHYGALLRFGGKAVIYGTNSPMIGVPFGPMILNFATLYFFMVYRLPPDVMQQTISGITQLLERGALEHPETSVFGLEQIVQAHEKVEQGANAKVLIRF